MKVKDVSYYNEYMSGCETCDYGSSFIDDFKITLESGEILHIESDHMYYKKLFSEAMVWRMIDEAENEEDLIRKINEILDKSGNDYVLYVNGEKIYTQVGWGR